MRGASLFIMVLSFYASVSAGQKATATSSDTCSHCMRSALIISGSGYAVSMVGLYELWYKPYTNTSFHFFNDNRQWLQMDKAGHAFTAYSVGRAGLATARLCGDNKTGHRIWAASSGLIFLTTVEVFDGFSTGWGASLGDLGANLAGAGLVMAQDALWSKQRMIMKFSYHPTTYPQYNPDVLGKTWQEQVLKDYNGQSYWLSIPVGSFMSSNSKFPRWLCVSLGYSGEEMIKGSALDYTYTGSGGAISFSAYRQYLLSLDIATDRIKVKKKWLKYALSALSWVKIPMPAVAFSKERGAQFHPLYF